MAFQHCLTAETTKLQDHAEALELAQKAAELSPASPHILDTLALAYWLTGQRENAIQAASRAVEVDIEKSGYYLEQLEKYRINSPPINKTD